MKVADYVAYFLAEKRVPAVFELVGGMITFLIDSINHAGQVQLISMHHEQAAAFAAEATARISGIPGVAMATSGPGATNLLTGIASCYFDSTPSIFITGQVNRSEQKGSSGVRQLGFQETEIILMVRPIVKRSWAIGDPNEIPEILEEAFKVATSGRPGPVLIDIPMDVQRAQIDVPRLSETQPERISTLSGLDEADATLIRDSLLKAKKPIILAGGGIRISGAVNAFRNLVEVAHVPVVHSLMAVDTLPSSHALNAGMIGSYGNRWSNLAIAESDLLLVLGSRLDVRQTGADTEGFRSNRQIFHIDCDEAEINNRITGCHAVVADLLTAIPVLTKALSPISGQLVKHSDRWLSAINASRAEWPDVMELKDIEGINPNQFMRQLSRANVDCGAYVVDVGQHQMWAAQSLEIQQDQRFLTSGGLGSMGFALPAAIGSAITLPGKPIVSIAGDGAFQCNIQELETARHLQLPIRMVIINNQCHGMVRQFQESYFGGRYQSTVWGYSAPDFAAVAVGYGVPSKTIASPSEIEDAVGWLARDTTGPSLLQVMISTSANAYPKLAFGKGMASMEPLVLSTEMEAT